MNFIMRLKRGVIDIQFNWIFVLISGAIILLLFIGMITRQENLSGTYTNTLVLNNLDAVLSGHEISTGTVNVVKIPEIRLEFGCDKYSVDGISKQLDAMNVFAPSVLEGNNMISTTLGFSMPYKVTNLMYLTNPKIRYVFVGDSGFAREIFETMPDEIRNDGYTNTQAIQDENDDNVRIIFFDQDPEIPESLAAMKGTLTALKVDGNHDTGTLEFFDLGNNEFVSKGITHYIKDSTLLGAVFTDDINVYNCIMENTIKKLNIVSKVYEGKIDKIKDGYSSEPINDTCRQFYEDIAIYDDLTVLSSSGFDSSLQTIINAANEIEMKNSDAGKLSCLLIY